MTPRVHDLVRVDPRAVRFPDDVPPWARATLDAVPWTVVRRAKVDGWIAIGVRGAGRAQRCEALVRPGGVRALRTPESLANVPAPADHAAFESLAHVRAAADALRLRWGPVGAVGFALASGAPVVHAASDLDLVVREAPCERLAAFAAALQDAPARCDVLVEGDAGGIALAELLDPGAPVLLRTALGPVLTSWPAR